MQFFARPTPHVIAFFLFLAFYLLLVNDVRHWSSSDPGSIFFDPDRAFERHYSRRREAEAEAFVASASELGNSVHAVKASPDHSMCVGIATVQREGARYFRRAVGSVLAGLTENERRDLELVNFIVNTDPTKHQAYSEPWLAQLSDRVLTYTDAPNDVAARARELEGTDTGFRQKPLLDYVYLLRTCYNTEAPYIVMLEDDTIAADGWYYRTKSALEALTQRRDFQNTVYMRLFYNERLMGWNSEEWMSYVAWSSFMEILLIGIVVGAMKYYPPASKVLTARTAVVICGICGPMLLGLYFAAGRMTVAPLSRGLNRMETYGCCSQAFVFPRERVPQLIEYYESAGAGYIDVLTERYANEHRLSRWALTPSVFAHVGGKSSKGTSESKWNRNNAENIWNFSFERFVPEELAEDHLPS